MPADTNLTPHLHPYDGVLFSTAHLYPDLERRMQWTVDTTTKEISTGERGIMDVPTALD